MMAKREKKNPEKKKRQSARVPKLKSLGKYQIQKEIGAGGMGAVFLARDTTLNRLAALKVLPRDKAENPVLVKRFKAEGQAAAHLRHENIVSVYDAGEEDGYLYIALEYVEGTDLHNLINKRTRIPINRSLEIITQVTQALAHAYEQGIVHRDIKPANILIRSDGIVKLTDLGLARSIDDNTETSITRAGTTVGTVDYMAPEQARDSKAADIRSDLYSLGCTWYHMLVGRAPFSEGSLTNKLAAHATTPPPDPRELNEQVPEGIVAIIQRMMAKSQSERYQTPEGLLDDIKNSNLKRSNVDNDVLEALANDESDGEQAVLDQSSNMASDSSEFQMNQFVPDYTASVEDPEDEVSNHPSTSFDLQDLAAEVENEPESDIPDIKRAPKSVKRSIDSKPLRNKKEERLESPRSAPEPEEDSVISDSAMKVRQAARSRKQEKPVGQRKRARQPQQKSNSSRNQPPKTKHPSRRSQKTAPVSVGKDLASDGQVAVDYKRIVMLIGGLFLFVLLIWWGINALSSSNGVQPGARSNPFAPAGRGSLENQDNSAVQGSPEDENSTASTENLQPQINIEDVELKAADQSSNQNQQTSEQWQNLSVRGGEKKYLPSWGAGFSALVGPNQSSVDLKLPVFKVAKGSSDSGVYESLNEALSAVKPQGAVVRLIGPGPFLLNPQRLQNISQLIVMADSKQNSVVVLQANPEIEKQSEFDLVSFSSGTLRFQGIHFLFDASQISGSGACNVFGIKQADLSFQNSSFLLTGKSQRSIRLIKSMGNTAHPQGESRIFLENSVIFGDRLESIYIDQLYADVLISNCLISTKGVPSLELANSKTHSKTDTVWEKRKVSRTVRIFSSTLLSDRSIFELNGPSEAKNKKQTPEGRVKSAITEKEAEIIVVNSVLIGDPEKKQSSMLSLVDWPQDKFRTQSKNRFNGLDFKMESALLWGWPLYLSSHDSGKSQNVFRIDSHRTWQQSWGKIVPADAFNPELPPELYEIRTAVLVRPLLDFSKQKAVYAISEGGVIAGCDAAVLKSPSPEQLKRVQAYLHKPLVKQAIHDVFKKAKMVSFDMTKGDLSEFLRSSAISGPTHVNISGQGICYTSPLIIENKQVRLHFQQNSGTRPIVELKLLTPSAKKRPRDRKAAGVSSFITVRNSTVDLVGGNFRISTERKGVVPKHFLVCTNSQVALDQCALQAILVNDRRFQSVVNVEPSDVKKAEQILIDRSFLAASGTIVESRAARLNLDVQNSLLLSLKNIFALETQNSVPPSLQVSLRQSTFAPGESVFVLEQTAGEKLEGDSAIQIFADESIFMPAPATGVTRSSFSKSASLFSIPQAIQGKQAIQWWGNMNGFMVERLNLLKSSISPSSKTDAGFSKEMALLFGNEADLGALTTVGGIMLKERKLPSLVKIKSSHFELMPTCKAASWSGLKQQIGADAVALEKMILGSDEGKASRIKRAF